MVGPWAIGPIWEKRSCVSASTYLELCFRDLVMQPLDGDARRDHILLAVRRVARWTCTSALKLVVLPCVLIARGTLSSDALPTSFGAVRAPDDCRWRRTSASDWSSSREAIACRKCAPCATQHRTD